MNIETDPGVGRLKKAVQRRRGLPFLATTGFLDCFLNNRDKPPILREALCVFERVKGQEIFIYDDELIVGRLGFEPLDFHQTYGMRLPFGSVGHRYAFGPTGLEGFGQEFDREVEQKLRAKGAPSQTIALTSDKLREAAPYSPQVWAWRNLTPSEADAARFGLFRTAVFGGHSVVDHQGILERGLKGYLELIETKRAGAVGADGEQFYDALSLAVRSVSLFITRHADLAGRLAGHASLDSRREELAQISAVCEKICLDPPESFREALQMVWFVHVMEGCDSLGRFDHYLWPFYDRDIRDGRMTRDEAAVLVAHFWLKTAEIGCIQNLTLGGLGPTGLDACNDLTRLCLEVTKALKLAQPNVCLRLSKESPEWAMEEALGSIASGNGLPALYNDEAIVASLLDTGIPVEDARDYCLVGCSEVIIPGKSHFGADSGELNVAKCLELALNDGVDPLSGKRLGPATGSAQELLSFADVMEAFEAQVTAACDLLAGFVNNCDDAFNKCSGFATRSAFTRGCIESGKGIWDGGALYNASEIECIGMSNVADSLAAIKKVVFEDGLCSLGSLVEVLARNWEGDEALRLYCRNRVPKFGNDDDYVDRIAEEVTRLVFTEVRAHGCRRGGPMLPGEVVSSVHPLHGRMTGATPEGRHKGEPLGDSCGPVQGRDRLGPTALARSVAKLDQSLGTTCLVLNMKFGRSLFGASGRNNLARFLRTYFDAGGMQVQVTVVDRETLLAAKAKPEGYRDLIVRVGGFSAHFTSLEPDLQDEIIARTEYC